MKNLLYCCVLFCVVGAVGEGAVRDGGKGKDAVFLKEAALKIDQQISIFYQSKKLTVPEVTDDATFLRRAFLVSVGRIPTPEEALAFLEIDDGKKREELVSYLMNSKGYSSHLTNWAFDLLRLRDTTGGGQANHEPYRAWVREAMAENMPWDEFVEKLVSSSGDGWDPKTASVGYYTIDRGMPLDNLANTLRIFLGSRMECAQCHDDPYGKTERKDFYHLAAFTDGQAGLNELYMEKLWSELQDDQKERGDEYQVAQLFWDRVYGMSQGTGGRGRIELPTDYQYRDGRPGELVGARTPFGKAVRMSDRKDDEGGRKQFADWITMETGEQFAGTIANRMWERIMGKGIYEPVDEYMEPAKTVHPELMKYLAGLMHELNYDLRAFQHVLMLTRTFQFGTNPNDSAVAGGDDFHGRKIERLSAEQIWDSLITLSSGSLDDEPRRKLDDRIFVGGEPVLVGKMNMKQLSKEVLALDSEAAVRGYFNKFRETLKSDGAEIPENKEMAMSMAAGEPYSRDAPVRASELPSPAPREHFLYLFGSSDREVVEGASLEPNVGQVLSMMNGFVQRQLVSNSGAHIYKSLEGASSEVEKIRRLYVAILNRPPTEKEMGWMKEDVMAKGDEGYRNIVAALVMSSEFLFLQ